MTTSSIPTVQNFINAEAVDPADGQTEEILNPATGEVMALAPVSTEADVDAPSRRLAPRSRLVDGDTGERALALLKLAGTIEEHADELAELESDNAGKPIEAFRATRYPSWSTTCASSPVRRAAWRAARRASTQAATRRSSAASRSA